MERYDVAIIGAGLAGASLACALAERRRVLLIEQESQPGYHSTGRSAATLHRSYGNATVRALTAASAPFFLTPPPGFASVPLSRPRGLLIVADQDQLAALEAEYELSRRFVAEIERLGPSDCLAHVPSLRRERVAAGLYDPTLLDLDVDALLRGFLKGAASRGAVLRCDAGLRAVSQAAEGWRLDLGQGSVACAILINAAGAWADAVAELAGLPPLGIEPRRRTAITVPAPEGVPVEGWPMIHEVTEAWYVKPDAGRLLGSPADQHLSPACDAQPEELDVAICVDLIEQAFDFPIRRVLSRWAGLRCFAPDKTPVVGFDPRAPGFYWLAGQGGYGIQTAPALAALATAQITGEPPPAWLPAPPPVDKALAPARLLAAA
jgi:D-arginine dehydrogenase